MPPPLDGIKEHIDVDPMLGKSLLRLPGDLVVHTLGSLTVSRHLAIVC